MTDEEKNQLCHLAEAVRSDAGRLIIQSALNFMVKTATENYDAELVKGMGMLINHFQSVPQELAKSKKTETK